MRVFLYIAAVLFGLALYILAIVPPTPEKVVLEQFITVTNPEKGYGYYLARTFDDKQVIIEDEACKYGIGDTIVPLKILK